MKNKRKKDVSDSSNSDKTDNLPSPLNTSMHLDKSSKRKSSPKKKPGSGSDNRCNDNSEPERTEPRIEVFENEFRNEMASNETTDIEFREINSNNDKSVPIKSIFNIEELTSDDEIYTLQCPENYLKQNLCNKTIDFTQPKQTIIHNKEIFLLELINSEKKFITLAVPKKISGGSLIKMPLKGHIVIQKVVEILPDKSKSSDNNENAVYDKHNVVFPDNIKVRHPLLGVEWKTHIDLANKVIRKEYSVKKNNNKIKKNKSLRIKEAEIKSFKRESSDSNIIIPKKKKKKSDA